jgi:uncharacterized integral membrane protein
MVVVVFGLAFHIKNDQPVILNYYVDAITVPHLSWVVIASLLAGVFLGVLATLNTVLRLKREVRRLAKKNEVASKEILNLRAIPIKDAV